MDVIIGREAGVPAPRLCLKVGTSAKFIGAPGSVPKTVSRNHCRLELMDDGKMRISNVSDQNSLFVNGTEYKTKLITKDDLVQLGSERFNLDITAVLKVLDGDSAKPKVYKVSHLKHIWENYIEAKDAIQKRNSDVSALRGLPSILSMGALAAGIFAKDMDSTLRTVLITGALILTVVFFYIAFKNGRRNPAMIRELDEKFQDEYVCPNCKHYLGYRSYKLVLKDGGCPRCKAKFTE